MDDIALRIAVAGGQRSAELFADELVLTFRQGYRDP
jgi:hypothetical protein